MTFLQCKKRRSSSRRSISPGKQVLPLARARTTPTKMKGRSMVPVGGDDGIKLSTVGKPKFDSEVEFVMRRLVEVHLSGKGTAVSMKHLAAELAQSKDLKDAFANRPCARKPSLTIDNRLKKAMNWGKGFLLGLQDRYHLTGVLNDISRRPGADTIMVDSWESAKEAFSRDIDFPAEAEQTGLSQQFAKMRVLPPKFDTVSYFPQLQADKKLTEVAQSVLPKKIEDEEIDEKGALASHVEELLAEREVQKAEEQAKFDDLEQQMEERNREEEARNLASSLLRDYTNEEEAMIASALHGPGSDKEEIQKEGADTVLRGSMRTLRPGQWLNDEVIHFFLLMLKNRDEELCSEEPDRKRSHFFKSFFITKLLNEGHTDPEMDGVYEYRNVKRWSKKAPGKDIFKLDKVFFPINQNRSHWVCAVAFMKEKRIQFYDSMGASGNHYLSYIFQYIQDEHKDKKKSPLPDVDDWELVPCTGDTPQQGNGFDCGVFTCMFADFLSKDCPLLFTQDHVDQCRKRIALSILLGKAII